MKTAAISEDSILEMTAVFISKEVSGFLENYPRFSPASFSSSFLYLYSTALTASMVRLMLGRISSIKVGA